MSRRIEIVDYNPEWPSMYADEIKLVSAVLREEIVRIHHIGSTSVPGLKAKPVIDLLVEVDDIFKIDEYNATMAQLGYRARGELDIPGRRYFSKETDGIRSHHLHCYPLGHPEIERHLTFRDYLREHTEIAEAYERLKEDLAARHRYDSHAYTEAKSEFILDIDRKAERWRKEQEEQDEQKEKSSTSKDRRTI